MDKKSGKDKMGKRRIKRARAGGPIPEVGANEVINCPSCGSFLKRVQVLEAWRLACGKCGFITDQDIKRSVIRRSGRGRPTRFNQSVEMGHPTYREFEAWTMILQEYTIEAVSKELSMTKNQVHHAVDKIQGFIDEEIDVESLRKPLYALAFTGFNVIREALETEDSKVSSKLAMDLFKGLGVLRGETPPIPLGQLNREQFDELLAEYSVRRSKAVTPDPPKTLGDNSVIN